MSRSPMNSYWESLFNVHVEGGAGMHDRLPFRHSSRLSVLVVVVGEAVLLPQLALN